MDEKKKFLISRTILEWVIIFLLITTIVSTVLFLKTMNEKKVITKIYDECETANSMLVEQINKLNKFDCTDFSVNSTMLVCVEKPASKTLSKTYYTLNAEVI